MIDQVAEQVLDVDKPIPYTLTALGRRTCEEIRARVLESDCNHHWHPNLRCGLKCCECGDEASVKRSNRPPQYAKSRHGRD